MTYCSTAEASHHFSLGHSKRSLLYISRHCRAGKTISPTYLTCPTSSIPSASATTTTAKAWHTFRMPSSNSFERPCAAAVFRSTAFRVVHRRCCLCCMSRTAMASQTTRNVRLEGREAQARYSRHNQRVLGWAYFTYRDSSTTLWPYEAIFLTDRQAPQLRLGSSQYR